MISSLPFRLFLTAGLLTTILTQKLAAKTTPPVRIRLADDSSELVETVPTLATPQNGPSNYIGAVLDGHLQSQHDLTFLDTNVAVVHILNAGRRSAQTGRTIRLASATTVEK